MDFFPKSNPMKVTGKIIQWWYKRWASQRIFNQEVMRRVESHTLIYPINHGARAPKADDPSQPSLFVDT